MTTGIHHGEIRLKELGWVKPGPYHDINVTRGPSGKIMTNIYVNNKQLMALQKWQENRVTQRRTLFKKCSKTISSGQVVDLCLMQT